MANFGRSLAVQRRVIFALLMREVLTRYGRHNIGFLWLFVEPMIFTVGITILWNATGATHGSNLPISAFALTGYSTVLLWRNMPGRCSMAVTPNLALMYHRNVKVIDIFIARILLEVVGNTASFFVLMITFHALGLVDYPEDILEVMFAWVMIIWFGASLGFIIGALSEKTELVEKLWHPVTYLMFPLSGAIFMVDWLSPAFQKIVLWLPMVHGVEMLREGYFGSLVAAHYDIGYMACACLAMSLVGLALVRDVGREVTPE
ncbi:ABC transporter permease [Burkholderia pseudomallei]|uniref:ABC transporter permease n=1 Tax=Burkholderia pseudomallei TaxID=28450 RepID=UPI00052B0A88|nr:ABC transporter permease [Burkholderia pseudomallei]AIV91382.1 ABC-2 type transporter family protein [Burkholderia pseudomallei B03]AIV97974.1 ABC-2 type transporter family protein [Burkholderia pseudomallei A79A]KGS51277.1 ABC-2 type transporter family protein [Burkholderia pseudomallei ABCPW 107]KGY00678.1 ABC-2 type transporter family protein [Burkholderia pseudomallei A79D]KGY02339.1 ABC-2 type transporter family protein [Burkholderia pseudomallei A79C]